MKGWDGMDRGKVGGVRGEGEGGRGGWVGRGVAKMAEETLIFPWGGYWDVYIYIHTPSPIETISFHRG